MTKDKLLLVGLIVFFLVSRFYKIAEIPGSLYWDEASIAYNAYSVLKTGRDEWGEFLPLHFRAFGEFKLPVYIYTVAFFEIFLGISEFAVRAPSVFFSLGVVLLTYFITLKITSNRYTSLFAAFLLSISPWFFIFSRTGFEAVAGLMFFMLGIYLSLFLSRSAIYIVLGVLSFILSMYSYNAYRILAPPVLVYVICATLRDNGTARITKLSTIAFAIILVVVSFIPIVRVMKIDTGSSRLQAIGVFSQYNDYKEVFGLLAKNYLSHFDLNFLFINGDKILRHQQPGFGQLYLIQLPFLILGLFLLLKKRELLFLSLTLISFIPPSIATESPHALRSLSAVPFLSIITAYGIDFMRKKVIPKNYASLYIILIFFSFFGIYIYSYFNSYNFNSSSSWQYGYKMIFEKFGREMQNYDKVIISDTYAQPYIFALFYLKYDPDRFRSTVNYNPPDKWGFSTVGNIGRFIFSPVRLDSLPKGKSLVFASTEERLAGLNEQNIIRNLDSSVAFYVYKYEK